MKPLDSRSGGKCMPWGGGVLGFWSAGKADTPSLHHSVLAPGKFLAGLATCLSQSRVVFLTAMTCATCIAADDRYSVDAWQKEDGLPSDTVLSLAQTGDGFLWVGTDAGLARFDGMRFTVSREPKLLDGARVEQLFTDKSGVLWVSLKAGKVLRLLDGRFVPVATTNTWTNATVISFAQIENGDVLLSTDHGGLWRFHEEKLQGIVREWPFGELATELAADVWGAKTVWLRRGASVGCVQGTNWTKLSRSSDSPPRLGAMAPRRAGGVWLFAADHWLDVVSDKVWPVKSRVYPQFMDPSRLLEDSAGNLWIGTTRQGLVRLSSDGSVARYFTGTGFPTDYVTCLLEDREGNVWVGGNKAGLMRISRRAFFSPGSLPGLPSTAPLCLTADEPGAMWVGFAEAGLYRISEGKILPPVAALGRSGWAVLAARDGRMWLGAYAVGLVAMRGGTARTWNQADGLPSNDIQALAEDAEGAVWIGSARGLARFDGEEFINYTKREGLPGREVHALAIDRANNIWAGTTDAGLVRWSAGKSQVFTTRDGLPSNNIRTLRADLDGSLWIGTAAGLCWRRGETLFAFDERTGLPSHEIVGVADDELGNLWLATSHGVVRISRSDLLAVAEGKRALLTVRSFGCEDGLPSVRMSVGQPCAARAQDGQLWFATQKGLAVVDPREVRSNVIPPAVIIEEALVDGVPLMAGEAGAGPSGSNLQGPGQPSLRIPPGARRIEFRYTAPELTEPERARYQVRVEGLDDDWQPATTQRIAAYQGLRPGHYRLRVAAANGDGVWRGAEASMAFLVAPWFWETSWFRFGAGAAAVMGLAGVFWLRMRTLESRRAAQEAFSRQLMQQQEAERKRIAAELHDSLEQNLLVIKNRALLALGRGNAPADLNEALGEISTVSSDSIQEVRSIANNLRPHQLTRLGLTRALAAMLRGVTEASRLQISSELAEIKGLLTPEQEIHLYRIAQESLNNIIKHSHATEASFTLRRELHRLTLRVQDNGRGFDAAAALAAHRDGAGFGLTGLAERAKMLGGQLKLVSSPGAGTEVRVEIPVSSAPNS